MNLYFCENDTKGNHFVLALGMVQAINLFTKSTGIAPNKVTACDENVIMESNLSLVKEGRDD